MTSPTHKEMQIYTDKLNSQFSVHALWNGYNIRMFKHKNLVIGGSQDWIYYHDIDIIFKKVIFFNLPSGWSDTLIKGDDLFRLTNEEEFKIHHQNFDTQNQHIFAFDLVSNYDETDQKHTFFVVAKNVFLEKYTKKLGDGIIDYKDPLGDVGFQSKENRV